MKAALKSLPVIILLSLVPTLAVWAPFFLNAPQVVGVPIPDGGMGTIVRNYDGPLYIVVAKTLYNPELIKQNFSFNLPTEYYAAHFPLYPLLIRLISLPGLWYPYAMLLITVLSSVAALWFFYLYVRDFVTKEHALWMTTVFAIFPARWLIVRSVGSPEPLFLALIIASIYFFQHKKYILAGIFGALAQFTKSPGILLFAAYGVAVALPALKHAGSTSITRVFERFNFRSFPVLLIPLALVGVFAIYSVTYGDFFAYFKAGDNIHLFFPPFQIFNYSQAWVSTHWLEEIIFVYMFGALGILHLIKQKRYTLASFVGIYFATTIFVSHRDLIRYSLPIVPFLLIAFENVINSKEFRYVFAFLILPIYLFTLAYISQNHMQISDWAPLL